jgi:hypothetical protein
MKRLCVATACPRAACCSCPHASSVGEGMGVQRVQSPGHVTWRCTCSASLTRSILRRSNWPSELVWSVQNFKADGKREGGTTQEESAEPKLSPCPTTTPQVYTVPPLRTAADPALRDGRAGHPVQQRRSAAGPAEQDPPSLPLVHHGCVCVCVSLYVCTFMHVFMPASSSKCSKHINGCSYNCC